MKKTKHNNQYLVILSVIFILLVIVLSYQLMTEPRVNTNSVVSVTSFPAKVQEAKYYSDFLRIGFLYPQYYRIEEIHNSIYLKGGSGTITIDHISTNYKTIEDHLNGLEILNKVRITNRQEIRINNFDSIKAIIKGPNSSNPDTHVYFFYPEEWTIYSISTDSIELTNDLDRIAQSFKYNLNN